MTTLSDVKGSAINLLSQLLQGGGTAATVGGGTDADGAAGGFVEALGRRLRELLVQAGADPAEVAALDGQALLAQCMSLIQGQTQSASAPLPEAVGADAALPAATGEAPETPGELLEWLRQSAGVETAGQAAASVTDLEQAATDADPEQGASLAFARQLLRAIRAEGAGDDPDASDVRTREPLRPAALAPLDLAALDRPTGLSRLPPDPVAAAPVPLTSAPGVDPDPAGTPSLSPRPAVSDLAAQPWSPGASDPRATELASGLTQDLAGRLADLQGRHLDADADPTPTPDADATPTTTLGLLGSLAADRQAPALRNQVLDLSRLLQPGGEAGLAEQVSWVMQKGGGSAELKLHPANLGSLDVRITLEDDQAHVQFVSPHPIVREVIEAALPRLREALAQEGVTLGNVSVSDQPPGGRGEPGQERAGGLWSDPTSESASSLESEEPPVVRSTLSALAGRHDYFA